MCHFNFIPVKTVTKMADEYLQNSLQASSVRELKLRKSLSQFFNKGGVELEHQAQDSRRSSI